MATKTKTFVISKIKKNHIYLKYDNEPDSMRYVLRAPHLNTNVADLNYISVLPGSGKTHWAINRILNNDASTGFITLYVAPTVKLLREVHKNLLEKIEKHKRQVKLICSEDSVSSVLLSNQFKNKLANAKEGDVFLITHALYSNLSEFPYGIKQKICLLFDEASEFSIQHTGLKLDYDTALYFRDNVNAELYLKSPDAYESLKTKKAGYKVPADIFFDYRKMYVPKWSRKRKYHDTPNFNSKNTNTEVNSLIKRMKDNRFSVYAIEQSSRFSFFNFMSPDFAFSGINEVFLMSAFFELSELFHILSKNYHLIDRSAEVEPERIEEIRQNYKRLRLVPVTSSNRLLSSFLLKKCLSFSETLPQKAIDKAEAQLNEILKIYKEALEGQNENNALLADLQNEADFNIKQKDYVKYVLPFLSKRVDPTDLKYPIFKILERGLMITNKIKTETKPLLVVNNFQTRFVTEEVHNKAELISVKSHGLNVYSDKKVLMFFAALNPSPAIKRFYSEYIPNFSIPKQWIAANALQAVARTSLRLPENKDKIYLILYSEKTAKLIQETLQPYLKYKPKIKYDKEVYYSPRYIVPSWNSRFIITDSTQQQESKKKTCNQKSYLSLGELKVTTEKLFRQHVSYNELFKQHDALRIKIKRCKDKSVLEKLLEEKTKLEIQKAKEKQLLAERHGYDYTPNDRTLKLLGLK